MSECERVAERLTAYLDETLSPAERAEVQGHLSACPPCRLSASEEQMGRAVVRTRAEQLRTQPLPPGLRSRCEALAHEHMRTPSVRSWRARLVPVTLAAALLVVTGAAILLLATRRSDALLAAQLTADHMKCFRQFVAQDAPPLDARAVEATLAASYGWRVHLPPSAEAEGVRLVHARRCLYADGRIPHVLYRVHGRDVSLFMLDGVARAAADVTAFGHRSHIWTRGGTTFVLVTPASGGNLAGALQYVMREAR